jgi:hypothetical protein
MNTIYTLNLCKQTLKVATEKFVFSVLLIVLESGAGKAGWDFV